MSDGAELLPHMVRPIIGDEMKERADEILELIEGTHYPIYLVGPSGSGKTHIGKVICLEYARRYGCRAHYVQVSQDTTRAGLLLGYRMVLDDDAEHKGWVPFKALIARVMEAGDIVFVDELTHVENPNVHLLFNSVTERDSLLSMGDMIVEGHHRARLLFASNDDLIAGNTPIPQSLGRRMLTEPFDYPDYDTELEVALSIAHDEMEDTNRELGLKRVYLVPDALARYMTSFVREVRSPVYPLSATQIAHLLYRVNTLLNRKKRVAQQSDALSLDGSYNEAVIRNIYAMLNTGTKTPQSIDQMRNDQLLQDFLMLVEHVGKDVLRERILRSVGVYTPLAGVEFSRKSINDKILSILF